MPNEKIVSYLHKHRHKYHLHQLKKTLIDYGHDEKEVNEAVTHVHRTRKWSKAAIISLIVGILGLYFLFIPGYNIMVYLCGLLLGIISIQKNQKRHLKGYTVGLTATILSLVLLVFSVFIIFGNISIENIIKTSTEKTVITEVTNGGCEGMPGLPCLSKKLDKDIIVINQRQKLGYDIMIDTTKPVEFEGIDCVNPVTTLNNGKGNITIAEDEFFSFFIKCQNPVKNFKGNIIIRFVRIETGLEHTANIMIKG